MTAVQVIFYLFSLVAILSSVFVVASPNPVRGALSLVLTFFAMSGIWLLLQAEFLALILVLVYVGAVMTLFLFVVMMLRVNVMSLRAGLVRYLPFAILLSLLIIGMMVIVVGPKQFGLTHLPLPPALAKDYNNLADLGNMLYTNYAYPFEIAAVLLLTAIIAAISLTHRKPHKRKIQNITKQIAVKRADRVKLVCMPSAKKINLVNKPSGAEQ
ncbi:MAG: nuoJ [Gammaproteobacteria bacterium]|jgi:NADH-quinone oxidoreductase subunit J|nr:nuoJ [Gammaproteobacteria bacterium]